MAGDKSTNGLVRRSLGWRESKREWTNGVLTDTHNLASLSVLFQRRGGIILSMSFLSISWSCDFWTAPCCCNLKNRQSHAMGQKDHWERCWKKETHTHTHTHTHNSGRKLYKIFTMMLCCQNLDLQCHLVSLFSPNLQLVSLDSFHLHSQVKPFTLQYQNCNSLRNETIALLGS